MKYCTECGKKLNESAKFCSACGTEVDNIDSADVSTNHTDDTSHVSYRPTSSSGNVISGIGGVLTVVGFIAGFLSILFVSGKGEIFGYDLWSYLYGGGRETAIGIVFVSVTILVIGVFMLISTEKNNK